VKEQRPQLAADVGKYPGSPRVILCLYGVDGGATAGHAGRTAGPATEHGPPGPRAVSWSQPSGGRIPSVTDGFAHRRRRLDSHKGLIRQTSGWNRPAARSPASGVTCSTGSWSGFPGLAVSGCPSYAYFSRGLTYGAWPSAVTKSAMNIRRQRSHGIPSGGWSYSWVAVGSTCPQRAVRTPEDACSAGTSCARRRPARTAPSAPSVSSQPFGEDVVQGRCRLLVQP
jgi:hypothetical protein